MRRSKFVAVILICFLLFSVADVRLARAELTDLDKDDDGDIDLLDVGIEIFEIGMNIYELWELWDMSGKSEPAPAQKEEAKEESSWWWPF